MTGPRIKAGGKWLTPDMLKHEPTGVLTEHEAHTIGFCRSWLEGKQEFEFRTSGSTGPSKQIIFTREQLIASAQLTAQALNLKAGYQSLICLETKFIAGAMMLVRSLVVGMDMILKSPTSNPLEGIEDHIDFAAFVPFQLATILDTSVDKLNKMGSVIIGGGSLSMDLIGRLQDMKPTFYATYGMTETITHVALQKLNGQDKQDYFHLLPGIKAYPDNRGCITIQAPHLSESPIVTNDLVTFIDDKHFIWNGRYDHVINSGGMKVQAEKVELAVASVLKKLKIQKRFFVYGHPDAKLGQQVALVLEGDPFTNDEMEKIKEQLFLHLDKYEVPRIFLNTPSFAKTPTQKVDRQATAKLLYL